MTLGDMLSAGLVLQSIGIVGLLVQKNEATPTEPAPAQTSGLTPVEELRRQHQTSIIQRQHEGCGISEVPNGTYGFTYAPATSSPLFSNRPYQSFEMHKAADGRSYLLGYVTAVEAEAIRGSATVEVKLFPDAYEASTELVCLPLARLQRKTNNPNHEQGNWIPFFVEPAR
jgi:hypothetical protein